MNISLLSLRILVILILLLVGEGTTQASVVCDEDGLDAVNCALPVYEWLDSNKRLSGIVVTVHGATQQASSFEVLAKQLASQGFLVCSLDLRGHGKWHYKPAQFKGGYTVDYKQSVLDLEHLFVVLKKNHPGLPLYAIGESCGAAVLVSAASRNPDLLKGLILASVGTHPRHFKPEWVLPDVVRGFKNLRRPLTVCRYIKRYSSDDPRVPKEMVDDPLSRRTMSGKELIATALFIHSTPEKVKKLPGDLPLLMLQGTEDNICSPTSVKQIVRGKLGEDKQLIYMQDCGHVLLGTSFIKPQVSKIVVGWLKKRSEIVLAENSSPVALSRQKNVQSALLDTGSIEHVNSDAVIQN